jgi:hypothetical protein
VIRTDDLFLGAFALARGGALDRIEVAGINGRRVAYFHIDGTEAAEAVREYYLGPVVVNLQLLRAAVRRLKDEAFEAIRQEERRQRHATSTDQPGPDRENQVADRLRRARR